MLTRLAPKDIKTVRLALLEQQGYKCALCRQHCTPEQAVLDHDHKLGHVRAVLHRGCNGFLGHLEKNRYNVPLAAFLQGALPYLDLHSFPQTTFRHPSSRTPAEKKSLLIKRKKRKAKARSASSSQG